MESVFYLLCKAIGQGGCAGLGGVRGHRGPRK